MGLQQPHKLRLHHLSVLTTVMHRCLLDGDFERAGRAWGMILRTDKRSRRVDLRGEGRWGIGAEILLRREARDKILRSKYGGSSSGSEDSETLYHRIDSASFSPQCFPRAKEYYERLILQYPFSNVRPNAINALDFYPAMLGLWIHATQEEHLASLRSAALQQNTSDDSSSTNGESSAAKTKGRLDQCEAIRKASLQEAELIAARMDELILSPPYSDNSTLWKLRGMVSLWIGDLSFPEDTTEAEEEETYDAEESMNRVLARSDRSRGIQRKKEESDKAQIAFERAAQRDSGRA
ncbi:MAG: hypothetical protein M1832_002155 [Thelocarpon impressellum]|nr:MAG: hypothetical protein M1832_002155 [Thelocarpon impressellum]